MTRMHYEDPQFEIVTDDEDDLTDVLGINPVFIEPTITSTDEEIAHDGEVDEDAEVLREV